MDLYSQFEEYYADEPLCSYNVASRLCREHDTSLVEFCTDQDVPFRVGAMYDWRLLLAWLGY